MCFGLRTSETVLGQILCVRIGARLWIDAGNFDFRLCRRSSDGWSPFDAIERFKAFGGPIFLQCNLFVNDFYVLKMHWAFRDALRWRCY